MRDKINIQVVFTSRFGHGYRKAGVKLGVKPDLESRSERIPRNLLQGASMNMLEKR